MLDSESVPSLMYSGICLTGSVTSGINYVRYPSLAERKKAV